MFAKRVIKDAIWTRHINANRLVVIACQFLHARFPMLESRVSRAIELSGVWCVLTSRRPISYNERQCVNRRKTAPRVVGCLRIRSMSVISHTVQTVSRTWRLDVSVIWRL
jgi:hypothetical protein